MPRAVTSISAFSWATLMRQPQWTPAQQTTVSWRVLPWQALPMPRRQHRPPARRPLVPAPLQLPCPCWRPHWCAYWGRCCCDCCWPPQCSMPARAPHSTIGSTTTELLHPWHPTSLPQPSCRLQPHPSPHFPNAAFNGISTYMKDVRSCVTEAGCVSLVHRRQRQSGVRVYNIYADPPPTHTAFRI